MLSSATNTSRTTSLNTMSPSPQYCFPSSSSPNHLPPPPPPPPSIVLNQDDIFLHQNHQYDPTFLLANHNPQNIPEILINLGVSNYNAVGAIMASGAGNKQDFLINGLDPNLVLPRKQPAAAKKDRHSKIYTAQGLRDRRVRLSIEIAREFFDLHDMLGFDKASKTLEWLLSKSKKAIRELSRAKLRGLKSLSSTNSECDDQAVSEVNEVAHDLDHGTIADNNLEADQGTVLLAPIDKRNNNSDEALLVSLLAKESRAKARARARERTKEKRYKCNAACNYKNVIEKYTGSSSQISSQFRTMNNNYRHVQDCAAELRATNFPVATNADSYQEITCPLKPANGYRSIPEPDHNVVITRKCLKFPLISSTTSRGDCDQQRDFCAISKGESLNHNDNNNNGLYSSSTSLLLPPNWGINGTASPCLSFRVPT